MNAIIHHHDHHGPSPQATVDGWVGWLRTFRWDFVATCAFGYPTSPTASVRAVAAWLKPMPGAYAAIGVQHGPAGGRLHVHALVGGLGRGAFRESLLRGRWRRGSVVVEPYHPAQGFVEYLCRQATTVELLGTPVVYRPR